MYKRQTLDSIFNRVIQNWKKGKTTWIFADEFYLLFRYQYSADFFYRLYKRIRKYQGFVTGLTQNVEAVSYTHLNLIRNTTPKGAQSSDPFWEKSETALLQALMLYLLHEAPPEEQNFSMIMEMLGSAQVKEDDEEYQSPLDILFERLEMRNPESIAVKQYAIYKQAAGKTAKSILISVGVRLAAFNLKQIANLTCTDELDLYSIGEKKVALFCCIPDADTSLNYLVGMICLLYTSVKSLNEVVGFKNKIEEFQRTLVNQKAKELESQLKSCLLYTSQNPYKKHDIRRNYS